MPVFPRTIVGGISVSRMVVGTNWFLGYSHTSAAKDDFIVDFQTRSRITDILEVFLMSGVDTVMGPVHPLLIGDHEVIYNPERVIQRATRLVPNLKAEIVLNANHNAQVTAPDLVNQKLLVFFSCPQ